MWKFTALLTLLWLPSLFLGDTQFDNFFFWRGQLTTYTGVLSIGYMCLAVLLASRFRWVESVVKGLDKGYAMHKSLGIGATVTLVLHWLIVNSAKWLVEAQILARPNRGPRPEIAGINWHAVAEQVGDISFKVFLIFSLISLVQAISYKRFRFTHKLGGILVLAGVFHSVLLLKWNIESLPLNIAAILLCCAGVICSVLSLLGKIGTNNRVSGNVNNVDSYQDNHGQNSVIRFSIQLQDKIQYREGQFAYLNFHDGEAPHPFSVLDYDKQSNLITFAVKDLGDYTHHLVNKLQAGSQVTVEGSYGKFQLSETDHQVWVGAGIGIVPFLSRLYWLQRNEGNTTPKRVELFYCVNSKKEAFFEKEIVAILNKLSFINLHLVDADKGEFLTGEGIEQKMCGADYDVSFCGPSPFAKNLKEYLTLTGLPEEKFHQEIFRMR